MKTLLLFVIAAFISVPITEIFLKSRKEITLLVFFLIILIGAAICLVL